MGNLGDLEEISPTPGRPAPILLFRRAVESSRQYYNNMHVYPYTYLGGYFYRNHMYREAFCSWAEAANVIRRYNYNREDEEIYKEFLEIANESIPNIVKMASEGHLQTKNEDPSIPDLLHDPESFANLLRFYDGICEWEEGSQTPVLHVGWAKFMCYSLSRFDASVRQGLSVHAEGEPDEEDEEEKEEEEDEKPKKGQKSVNTEEGVKRRGGRPPKNSKKQQEGKDINENKEDSKIVSSNGRESEESDAKTPVDYDVNGKQLPDEAKIKSTIQELESKVSAQEESQSQEEPPNPNIAALAHACGESILNPEYLLSGGEPFTTQASTTTSTSPALAQATDTRVDFKEFLSSKSNGSPFGGMTMDSMLKAESPADMLLFKSSGRPDSAHSVELSAGSSEDSRMINDSGSPSLTLQSAKMKGLKSLLTSAKLNLSAIKLQLTAQSQVQLKHSKVTSEYEYTLPRKRLRRE